MAAISWASYVEMVVSQSHPISHKKKPEQLRWAKESHEYEKMINGGRHSFLSVPHLSMMLEGGVNIVIDGHTVGAVGVSGVKNMEDSNTAKAGIAAIL